LRQILGAIVGLAKKALLKARDPLQLAASIAATSRRTVFALTASKVTTEAIPIINLCLGPISVLPQIRHKSNKSRMLVVPCTIVIVLRSMARAWEDGEVGMSLEPSNPGSDYCHVSSMKVGGALANDGRVKPGDKLVRVDGFDCMGVPRAVIKSRVLGPPNSEVALEFQRDRRMFKVILLRLAVVVLCAQQRVRKRNESCGERGQRAGS
jgi:hypothetical protein